MRLRLIIGLFIVILLLSGCSAWEKAYEQASYSFSVVSIKGPSSLAFSKAMEPTIKPYVRLGDSVQYAFEDIWGFQQDKGLASVAAKYGTPVILMHNQHGTEYEGDMVEGIKRFALLEGLAEKSMSRIFMSLGTNLGYKDQPWFLNMVVEGETDLSPEDILFFTSLMFQE